MHDVGIIIAAVLLIGAVGQWISWWLKLPAILFLLAAGIIAGPVTGLIHPDALFGDLLFPLVSLGVAVILFEGSLTLRLEEIKGLARPILNLVTIGALVTWLTMSFATHYLLKFDWPISLLFGSLVVVTGPTVIVPLLRTVRVGSKLSHTLRWEGIVIDPLGAMLAVVVFEVISKEDGGTSLFVLLPKMCAVGGVFGVVGALILGNLIRRHLMPEYLHEFAALALMIGVFVAANTLAHESGLVAVTVMGVILANMKDVHVEDILDFKESLTIVLVSGLFILLAARTDLDSVIGLGLGAVWILLVTQLVARPLAVFVSTVRSDLSWRERIFLAWVAPRGIVAAAVASLFALKLETSGSDDAAILVSLTFTVILGTVIIQSLTAKAVANLVGVSEPDPRGVLIVGGNPVARAIAKALADHDFRVVLADNTWLNVSEARMEGIKTYFGNAVSEHADRHLDLVGVGRMLAMSQRPAYNALAVARFRPEFGSNHVFFLTVDEQADADRGRGKAMVRTPSQRLFGEGITQASLAALLHEGGSIRSTTLSEEFTFEEYEARYGSETIPLFALDLKRKLHVCTAGQTVVPERGWTLIALLSKAGNERRTANSE